MIMKRLSLAAVLIVGLCLTATACAGVGVGTPIKPPPPVAVGIAATGYGFDVAYREAAKDYLAATPAQQAAVKPLMLQLLKCPPGATSYAGCVGYIAAAGAAVDVADQATLTQQLFAISRLIGQVQAILHPGAAIAPPSVASLAAPPAAAK